MVEMNAPEQTCVSYFEYEGAECEQSAAFQTKTRNFITKQLMRKISIWLLAGHRADQEQSKKKLGAANGIARERERERAQQSLQNVSNPSRVHIALAALL